jgi:8-oxo-dGTP diphosphatase
VTCVDVTIAPLNAKRPLVLVAAAVLIDTQNKVLLAQRPPGKSMAGLWEFPGGKVGVDELPEAALVRELREELGIETSPGCLLPLTFASHGYPDFHLLMPVFACRIWRGDPLPQEGQALAWVSKNEWKNYEMPRADYLMLPTLFEMI